MTRLLVAAVTLMTLAAAVPVAAQGRITGIVRDAGGAPIKGATVRASHPEFAGERTSVTDGNGRWVLLGLRVAAGWRFSVEAPGFLPGENAAAVSVNPGRPLELTLRRDPGPMPGALVKDIAGQLSAAAALRDQHRYDEAIAAYQAIHDKNQRLSSLHLAMAAVYRLKADEEPSAPARRALLERAAASYGELLKIEAEHPRARAELAAVQATLNGLQ